MQPPYSAVCLYVLLNAIEAVSRARERVHRPSHQRAPVNNATQSSNINKQDPHATNNPGPGQIKSPQQAKPHFNQKRIASVRDCHYATLAAKQQGDRLLVVLYRFLTAAKIDSSADFG